MNREGVAMLMNRLEIALVNSPPRRWGCRSDGSVQSFAISESAGRFAVFGGLFVPEQSCGKTSGHQCHGCEGGQRGGEVGG